MKSGDNEGIMNKLRDNPIVMFFVIPCAVIIAVYVLGGFLVPTQAQEARRATGSITATAQAITVSTGQQGAVGIQITGTWSGTIVFQATVDGTNYVAVKCINANTGLVLATTGTTANGMWQCAAGGLASVRALSSGTWTSGTATVTLLRGDGGPILNP
jgi:hypothetical protein